MKRLILFSILTCAAASAAPDDLADALNVARSAAAAAQTAADNAWMLASCALVLLMTGPGLALFYGGLVRRKNVLGTMMHSFILMALASILWAVAGYSLAFAEGNAFLGGLQYLFLRGVGMQPNADYAATLPHLTFMAFQMMFAIITPALISGAYAERIRFSGMVVYTALWMFMVYFPMAHMVWGKGGLLNAFSGGAIPCFDFAGGTVVHITSGVSALIAALYLKPRAGYLREPMRPHSLVLSFAGACLLWFGWFGFNAGSALGAGPLAASAFVATHLGAAGGVAGWLIAEWIRTGKPSVLGAISGCVAGLVAITPASGFVLPMPALLIGLLAGVVCYLMVAIVKMRLGYDDSLDAFGVHGAGGTLGAILTGFFATNAVNDALKDSAGRPLPLGLVDGHPVQILYQAAGTLIAIALAAAGSFICLKLADWTCGLRAAPEHETDGLDLSMHGEEGYSFES